MFPKRHLLYDEEYEAAIANALNVISVQPEFPAAHLALWGGYFCRGSHADALKEAPTFYLLLRDSEVASALTASVTRKEYEAVMKDAAEILAARAINSCVA